MRLIFEGPCGRGKTTLANKLAEITAVPVYRPFRRGAERITPEMIAMVRQDIGLAINGWEEDVYVADMLASIPASVILDRSLPSALAYNETSSAPLSGVQRARVVRLWADLITHARATVVLLTGSEKVRASRSPFRGGEWEERGINRAMAEIMVARPSIQVWTVNTDDTKPEDLAYALARRITLGQGSAMITDASREVVTP